jgi:hypothetical protein
LPSVLNNLLNASPSAVTDKSPVFRSCADVCETQDGFCFSGYN